MTSRDRREPTFPASARGMILKRDSIFYGTLQISSSETLSLSALPFPPHPLPFYPSLLSHSL